MAINPVQETICHLIDEHQVSPIYIQHDPEAQHARLHQEDES